MTSIAGLDIVDFSKKTPDRLSMLLHGLPGSGKTYAASSIATLGKTLYIDLIGEHGTESFQGTEWAKNVDVVRPDSVTQVDDIYWFLDKGDHKYEAVVLDSISAFQKSAQRYVGGIEENSIAEIKKGNKPLQIQQWGQIKDIITDQCTFFASLCASHRPRPLHVVFTAQTKENTGPDGVVKMFPDLSEGSRPAAMAAFAFVGYTDHEEILTNQGEVIGKNIIRMGWNNKSATKCRVPVNLQGKIPPVLGLEATVNLGSLAKALGRA